MERRRRTLASLLIVGLVIGGFGSSGQAGVPFIRGDSNLDGSINIADSIFTLIYLEGNGALACLDSADVDDDGLITVVDAVYQFHFLFMGTAPPPPPFPACGADLTMDTLDCATYVCP